MLKELDDDVVNRLMDWVVKLEQENLDCFEDDEKQYIVKEIYKKIEEEIKCY